MLAVVRRGGESVADEALDNALFEIQRAEALMSSWIKQSEISGLNAATANQRVPLSRETLDVLQAARQAASDTDGAFDVTCRPVIELWRETGATGDLPTDQALAAARTASRWSHFEFEGECVLKRSESARVDLGGIAKGYAIDRAVAVLKRSGVEGGMVAVGGDIRLFGRSLSGDKWQVQIRDPFEEGVVGDIEIEAGAVCTSGSYARFVEIEGRRLSHIIDPRTARPAETAASVTLVAPDALTADIWATALSVLGEGGFARLPPGAEALLITGTAEDQQFVQTHAFPELIR
jgi:thiamine biosynthesis lipoprotein